MKTLETINLNRGEQSDERTFLAVCGEEGNVLCGD